MKKPNISQEGARLVARMKKIDKVITELKKFHKPPFDKIVECPECHKNTLRIQYQGPRAAQIFCSTKDCIRMIA